jgi:hypothetical protein
MATGVPVTIVLDDDQPLLLRFDNMVANLRVKGTLTPSWQSAHGLANWHVRLAEELHQVQNRIAFIRRWKSEADRATRWEFDQLVASIQWLSVPIEAHALQSVIEQAETQPLAASKRLTALILSALIESADRIKKRLSKSAHLRALLYFVTHRSDVSRTILNSQRAWFLHHGAHPCEDATADGSLALGGAFLLAV